MFSQENVAVLIICYEPTKEDIVKIKKNVSYFESSIIVWNSNKTFNIPNKKVSEIQLDQNVGQAEALNIGFQKAISMKIKLLMTLDQDSLLISSAFNLYELINYFNRPFIKPAGFSFQIINDSKRKVKTKSLKLDPPSSCLTPITSGCFYLTEVWKELNGFKSKLFIEGIDTEYALRAKLKKFTFYHFNYQIMNHDAGELITKKFLNLSLKIRFHNDRRIYLQYRNNLPLFIKYFRYFPTWAFKSIFNVFTKKLFLIMLSSKNIKKTLLMLSKGIFDGLLECTPIKKKLKSPEFILKKERY